MDFIIDPHSIAVEVRHFAEVATPIGLFTRPAMILLHTVLCKLVDSFCSGSDIYTGSACGDLRPGIWGTEVLGS